MTTQSTRQKAVVSFAVSKNEAAALGSDAKVQDALKCCNYTITLTRFTASKPNRLSKRFELAADGTLKKLSGGNMVAGTAERLDLSLSGFVEMLAGLTPKQALSYGVNGHEVATVVTAEQVIRPSGQAGAVIARTRDYFNWPASAGIFMLDYDAPPDGQPLTADALRDAIYKVWPALRSAPHIWRPSVSSCIYRLDTGECLRGIGGQRLYIPVANAADIPRCGAVLVERLWLAGYGRYEVSKSGALLARCLIDASVFQPERLDFCGGADCGQGLVQKLPLPLVLNQDAPFIDTSTLEDLDFVEGTELKRIKTSKAAALTGEVSQVKTAWVAERLIEALDELPPDKRESARPCLEGIYRRAADDGRLLADFILQLPSGKRVTVGEVLDNMDYYHNTRTLDPMEPDYDGSRDVGWLNLRAAGRPYLFSHAHGGKRYTLHRAMQTIQVESGELHLLADKTLDLMRLDGNLYQRDESLVRIVNDKLYTANADWIAIYLNRLAKFEKFDRREKKYYPTDTPPRLAKSLAAMAGEWNLPELRGVVTAPYMTPNGRIVETDGYDPETRLLLRFDQANQWQPIPAKPPTEIVIEALELLWRPFCRFPFQSNVDRGVLLAASLTAVQRMVLPTAPGTGFDAPAAGSGKSLLAKCICLLTGIDVPEMMPPVKSDNDDEVRKRLFAAARAGTRAIVFDNVVGAIESPALCAYLTSEQFSDRVLGVSENGSAPTVALLMLTGNNFYLVGDLNRRILRCRIDSRQETPWTRHFDLNPAAFIRERRLQLVRAALILLRACRNAGYTLTDSVASFEDWSDSVRTAVLWVNMLLEYQDDQPFFGDPIKSIALTYEQDPERTKLAALLAAWRAEFAGNSVTISDVIQAAERTPASALEIAANEIAVDRGRLNSRRLGRWVERMADRIVDGLCFKREGMNPHKKVALWRVCLVTSPTEEANGQAVQLRGFRGFARFLPEPPRKSVSDTFYKSNGRTTRKTPETPQTTSPDPKMPPTSDDSEVW